MTDTATPHPYAAAARATERRTGGLAVRLERAAREQADDASDAVTALSAALAIAIGLPEPADDDLPDALALAALDGLDLLRRAAWWRRNNGVNPRT